MWLGNMGCIRSTFGTDIANHFVGCLLLRSEFPIAAVTDDHKIGVSETIKS